MKFAGRIAAYLQPVRQVKQKRRKTLLGIHASEQHHQAMFAQYLAAHHPADHLLQANVACRQFSEMGIGNGADLRVFQCSGAAGMHAIGNPVQTHDFTGHVKTIDLLPSVRQHQVGPESAAAYDVKKLKMVAFTVKSLSHLDFAPAELEVIKALHITAGYFARKTKFPQLTTGASHFEWRNRSAGPRLMPQGRFNRVG